VHPTSGAELASAGEPHIRHILCLVNESTVARLAFEHARLVARTFGAWLTALYVSEPAGDLASAETLRRVEDRIRSWLTPGPAASSYGVQAIVRHGDAAAQVGSLAAEAAVDLVVIGAQHHRFVDATALGISTLRLTRHVPSPVLIVPGSSEAVLGVPQSASDAVEWRRGAA
jgi:nucleotide-binding universal stress UspA family protein